MKRVLQFDGIVGAVFLPAQVRVKTLSNSVQEVGKMKVSKSFASMLLVVVIGSLGCTNAGDKTTAGDKGGEKTIVGYVSDGMCGLDHSAMKIGDDKTCTLKCVGDGSNFVLADRDQKVVYTLDDAAQQSARDFAGQKVSVTGQVDAKPKTIQVTKIEAAK